MAISHAILAALTQTPCSGYDLSKQFAGKEGFFWYATQQQIYRELSKLEEQGYVSAEIIRQEGRPDKKILSITETGKEYLHDWIIEPTEVSPIKDELQIKLFAASVVPKAKIIKELENHRSQHQEILNTYLNMEKQNFPNPEILLLPEKYRYLTLRQGISFETQWLDWCSNALLLLHNDDLQ